MSPRWRATVDSVVKGLGSLRNRSEKRLSECIPPADRPMTDAHGQLKHYSGWHVFGSEYARSSFIKTALILLSANGINDLNNLTFDNFYSRSYDAEGNIWYTASIAAMDDFAIRHTILASSAGATKASAFRLLMLDIEIRMGALLRDSSGNIDIPSFIGARDSGISPESIHVEEEEKPMPVIETSLPRDSLSTPLENMRHTLPPDGNPAANDSVGPLFFDLDDFTFRSHMVSVSNKEAHPHSKVGNYKMATIRGNRDVLQRTRPALRLNTTPALQTQSSTRRGRGRVQKQNPRPRTHHQSYHKDALPWKTAIPTNVENACPSPAALPGLEKLKSVLRTTAGIHSCSEQSLDFVTFANLETNEDTNTIALNLMDFFLFSDDNWLPELSYCRLHAACFQMAGLITGTENSLEAISKSLGPDCTFVKLMASPLAEDEQSAAAIANIISVNIADAENAYALLYARREQLARLMGPYASNVTDLPRPAHSKQAEAESTIEQEEENFDLFDE